MSEEAKKILAHIGMWGATVVMRDGAPFLIDPNKALGPSDKAALKLHRQEIINVLSGVSDALFSESVPVKNEGLDVTGKKDRPVRKRNEAEGRPKVTDMMAKIVCERCYRESSGHILTSKSYGHLTHGVFEIHGKWFCQPCQRVDAAQDELNAAIMGAPALTEAKPSVLGLVEKWDELDRSS